MNFQTPGREAPGIRVSSFSLHPFYPLAFTLYPFLFTLSYAFSITTAVP